MGMGNSIPAANAKAKWYRSGDSFFAGLGALDGLAAADFAVNRDHGDFNGWFGLISRNLSGWAANDSEGVVKWISHSAELKDWQVNGVVEGLVERNPEQAIASAISEAQGPDQGPEAHIPVKAGIPRGRGETCSEPGSERMEPAGADSKSNPIGKRNGVAGGAERGRVGDERGSIHHFR